MLTAALTHATSTSSPSAQPAPADWNGFVDRFGITAAVGLIAAACVNCMVRNAGIEPPARISAMQLLLLLIVLGCTAVLSFRNPAQTTR